MITYIFDLTIFPTENYKINSYMADVPIELPPAIFV